MNKTRMEHKILHTARLSARGHNDRALRKFNKLRKHSSEPYTTALLDFHNGICLSKKGDTLSAESMLKKSAETFEQAEMPSLAGVSYMRLGDCLCIAGQYDEACEVLCKAEKLSENFLHLCEIKTILAASRMASDTVYDTALFIEPYEFMLPHLDTRKAEIIKYFSRAALIAAKACTAANDLRKSTECCLRCINACEDSKDPGILNAAGESAVLLCRNAVSSWDNELISCTAKTAYDFINNKPSIENKLADFVRLFHTCCLLRENQIRKAKAVLADTDVSNLDNKSKICYEYCNFLCRQEKFGISECESVRALIPLNNIDDFSVLTESIVDSGFPEAAAEIYLYSLPFFNNVRPLITRPLASLLYKLSRYSESAQYYSELVNEQSDPVLKRAYSLASVKAGDYETAKNQMTDYIDSSEDRLSALTLGAMLSLDEGYPADYCSSLYTELSSSLENIKGSTAETVDAYNRLGICLYRSGAALEKETEAFKKAALHAAACNATRNKNIHAVILCNLAECLLRNGDMDECCSTYKKAEAIFSDIDDADIIQYSSCLKFISDILLVREDSDGAIEKLKKAIALLKPYSETDKTAAQQLSLCHNTLGTIYFRLGKPELEIPELTKAIDLVKDRPIDNTSLSMLYSNRGEAYEYTGKYDLMLSDYMTFITLSEESETEPKADIRISQAAKWLSIGRYRENSQLHNEAIKAYRSALSLLEGISVQDDDEVKELAAFAYYQLGNAFCHNNSKNYSAGLDAYTRSLDILCNLPMTESRKLHLASTYEARSAFYEIFGEHSLSASDLKKAGELRQSISGIN